MNKDLSNPYRELPSVERLISDPQVLVKTKTLPKEVTLEVARKTINSARKIIASGNEPLTYEKIQKRLLSELDFIAQQLRGKITQSVYANSEGKQSKVITIEYNVRDKNEDTI